MEVSKDLTVHQVDNVNSLRCEVGVYSNVNVDKVVRIVLLVKVPTKEEEVVVVAHGRVHAYFYYPQQHCPLS